MNQKILKSALAITCSLGIVSVASAQSFNFAYLHDTTSPGNTAPPAGYHAAAAGNPFVADGWSSHAGAITLGQTINMTTAPGVTMTLAAGPNVAQFHSLTNLANASAEQQNLFAGTMDLGGTGTAPRTFTISGLMDGAYDIYVYAMAPDSATFITNIDINGDVQSVGGTISSPGFYAAGTTHSLHSVNIVGGSIDIITSTGNGFGSFGGLQFVMIPAPGALALLGVAGMIGVPRRRR